MSRANAAKHLARFALAGLLLLAAGIALRVPYASLLLPAWAAELRLLAPGTALQGVSLRRGGGDERIEVRGVTLRTVMHEGAPRLARISTTASTLLGNAVLHPVLILSLLVLAAASLRQYAQLAVAALPWILAVEALDIPVVLAEQLSLPAALAPGAQGQETWTRLLDGGGRYALCVAAACGAWATLGAFQGRRWSWSRK